MLQLNSISSNEIMNNKNDITKYNIVFRVINAKKI